MRSPTDIIFFIVCGSKGTNSLVNVFTCVVVPTPKEPVVLTPQPHNPDFFNKSIEPSTPYNDPANGKALYSVSLSEISLGV